MQRLFFALAILGSSACANAQTITTVAGNGIEGYGGDNGPATQAQLYQPSDIAIDASGNIYVSEYYNHRIRRFTPGGNITTFAGTGVPGFSGDGGPATAAQLAEPSGLAFDSAGNLYVAESHNRRIRRITPSGTISTIAGNGISGFSGDGGPATSASFVEPKDLAIDAAGNIYVADFDGHRIRRIAANGIISTVAGDGTAGYSGDGGPSNLSRLNYPNGLAVNAAGELFLSDSGNHRVRKIDVSGVITTAAGTGTIGFSGDGGLATAARMFVVGHLAFDASGNLHLGDYGAARIRKINGNGIINTIAGIGTYGFSGDGGPALQAEFNSNNGMGFDKAGNLYVADSNNARVRMISAPAPATNADVSLRMVGGPAGTIRSGYTALFSVPIRNAGPAIAPQPMVLFTGNVPLANVTVIAPSGWNCIRQGTVNTYSVGCVLNGSMAAGSKATFTYSAVAPSHLSQSQLRMTSDVSMTATSDPVPNNNTSTYSATIVAP